MVNLGKLNYSNVYTVKLLKKKKKIHNILVL